MENEPQNISEYLAMPVESPSDDAPEAELQTTPDDLQDGQSDAVPEDLASQTEPAQTESESEDADVESPGDGRTEAAAEPAEADATRQNEELEALRAKAAKADAYDKAIEQARQQQEERKQKGEFQQGLALLASGDLDDEDVPKVAERIIDDISAYGAQRKEAELRPLIETAQRAEADLTARLTALVATIRSEFPSDEKRLIQTYERFLAEGTSSEQIERNFNLRQTLSKEANAKIAKLEKENKALTAQLAGKGLQASGAYRVESESTGGPVDEPTSLADYLTNDQYGRPVGLSRRRA